MRFVGLANALVSDIHRRKMVERGRERVSHFSWERSTDRLLNVFSELLGARDKLALAADSRSLGQLAATAALAITTHTGSRPKR